MATFVYLEKTDETVTSYREVGKPALYPLAQRREEYHSVITFSALVRLFICSTVYKSRCFVNTCFTLFSFKVG